MRASAPLTPRLLKIGQEVLGWTENYLMKEHPQMERPYGNKKICPFVEPSVTSNCFYIVFHTNVGADERLIESIVLGYIDEFPRLEPFSPTQKGKKALVIAFPDIPASDVNVLDLVQENVKGQFVDAGLMVGQFHQKCPTPSVHNHRFHVSASCPHPIVAIRNMAPHDVIFLADAAHPEWFKEYNIRFGERFKDPENLSEEEKPLLTYYLKAKAVHVK